MLRELGRGLADTDAVTAAIASAVFMLEINVIFGELGAALFDKLIGNKTRSILVCRSDFCSLWSIDFAPEKVGSVGS